MSNTTKNTPPFIRGNALDAELTRLCREYNDRSCEFDINKAVREWYWIVQDIKHERSIKE